MDITSIIASSVAAAKEVPADSGEVEAAGDISGTATVDEPDAPESDESATDEPAAPAEGSDEPAAEPAAEETPEPEDEFATEHGIKSKDRSGRENRIPYSRVKVINENAVKKATAPLITERDTLKSHNSTYVARLERVAEVEHVMFNEPEQMLEILSTLRDDNGNYIYEKTLGGRASSPVSSTAARTPEGGIDFSKAPPPDAGNPDAPGYSPTGLQKLLAWTIEQATAQATAAAEARIGKRYEPIEKTFKQQQAAETQQRQMNKLIEDRYADMQTWGHFKENEDAIVALLREDSKQAATSGVFKHTPRSAYEQVVFGRLTSERQKIREELLAESTAAPRSTSAGARRTAPAAEESSNNTTEDIVLKAIRGMR